jgi:hypothetical protein
MLKNAMVWFHTGGTCTNMGDIRSLCGFNVRDWLSVASLAYIRNIYLSLSAQLQELRDAALERIMIGIILSMSSMHKPLKAPNNFAMLATFSVTYLGASTNDVALLIDSLQAFEYVTAAEHAHASGRRLLLRGPHFVELDALVARSNDNTAVPPGAAIQPFL